MCCTYITLLTQILLLSATHTHIYIQTYIHTYIHTHTYTHTHIHIFGSCFNELLLSRVMLGLFPSTGPDEIFTGLTVPRAVNVTSLYADACARHKIVIWGMKRTAASVRQECLPAGTVSEPDIQPRGQSTSRPV